MRDPAHRARRQPPSQITAGYLGKAQRHHVLREEGRLTEIIPGCGVSSADRHARKGSDPVQGKSRRNTWLALALGIVYHQAPVIAAAGVGSTMRSASRQNGTEQVRLGAAAQVSRRDAILAGGLAIVGAAGLTPAAAPPVGIVFGSDRSGFSGFRAATRLAVGLRWYFNIQNQFPPAWPDPFPNTRMTLSLRPNPGDLFARRLDGRLRAIIDSAPPNSELTFWHENTTGNPLGYPPDVHNARAARRMQEHGLGLCHGTHVKFGVITVGPVVGQLDWMAPDLDWYGDDLYEFPKLRGPNHTFSKKKVLARLRENLQAWQKVTGRESPEIRICETNSPYDSHRSAFFTTIADFLARHNGNRMLTYWNAKHGLAQGGLSGPWPPSQQVINTLTALAEKYNWTAP